MKKLSDWSKTWTIPQVIGVSIGMLCITAMCIVLTLQDDWGKLVHWLAQPEAMVLLGGIATLIGTLYHRALGLPPTPAEDAATTRPERIPPGSGTTLLVVCLALASHGCGASALQVSAASTVVAMRAVHVTGDVVHADEQIVREACADDACLAQNRAQHHSAELAIDALRIAVLAWMDAIGLALTADGGSTQDVLTAAAQAAIARAGDVVRELLNAGVAIPAELAAMIPGAS